MLFFKLSRKLHLTSIQSQKVVEPLRGQKFANIHTLVFTCIMVLASRKSPIFLPFSYSKHSISVLSAVFQ